MFDSERIPETESLHEEVSVKQLSTKLQIIGLRTLLELTDVTRKDPLAAATVSKANTLLKTLL